MRKTITSLNNFKVQRTALQAVLLFSVQHVVESPADLCSVIKHSEEAAVQQNINLQQYRFRVLVQNNKSSVLASSYFNVSEQDLQDSDTVDCIHRFFS